MDLDKKRRMSRNVNVYHLVCAVSLHKALEEAREKASVLEASARLEKDARAALSQCTSSALGLSNILYHQEDKYCYVYRIFAKKEGEYELATQDSPGELSVFLSLGVPGEQTEDGVLALELEAAAARLHARYSEHQAAQEALVEAEETFQVVLGALGKEIREGG